MKRDENDYRDVVDALKGLRAAGEASEGFVEHVMSKVEAVNDEECGWVVEQLRAMHQVEGPDLVPGVMSRIRCMEARRKMLRRISLWGSVAACIALVAGVLLLQDPTAAPNGPSDETVAHMDLSTPAAGAAWLLEAQLPEGGWDTTALGGRPEHEPALMALGLLALHRENADGYREAILRGTEALCALQNPDGSFGRGHAVRINQGLVSAVLLELNQTLQSPRVGEALAGALSYTRRASAMKDGAWGYAVETSEPTQNIRFVAGLPVRTPTEARELVDQNLQHLPLSTTHSSTNRFYEECLLALNLR